jgi:hypothetical protein
MDQKLSPPSAVQTKTGSLKRSDQSRQGRDCGSRKWGREIGGLRLGYAVMSFGGFLGIGEDYYPLPWSLLTYSPRLEGYEVNLSDAQLKGAPKYGKHEKTGIGVAALGQSTTTIRYTKLVYVTRID